MDLSHPPLGLAFLLTIGIATGNWWAGAVFVAAFFFSREHAQAEYRWIERYGQGKRSNMPWWGGFDPRVWDKLDAWTDWLLPTLLAVGFALAM